MSGEIAVRAYVTEAGEDKLTPHLRALLRAMLEQQPAPGAQVRRRAPRQRTQALQRVRPRRQRQLRLVLQGSSAGSSAAT